MMEIKPVDITMVNSNGNINKDTEEVEGQAFNLPKGQVLQAIILNQVTDKLYTARVGGKDICIQCFDLLPLNTQVELELHGKLGDIFLVKPVPFNASTPISQEELLQRVFSQLQIKDTPLHRNLIQSFLNQEIPLRVPALQMAERMLQKLGGDAPENIAKALLGIKLGIPPEPVVLNAVYSFLRNINVFQQGYEARLQIFINKLVEIIGAVRTEDHFLASGSVPETRQLPAVLSPKGYELLQKTQEYLRNICIEPDKGSTKIIDQLKILFNSQITGLVYQDGLKSTTKDVKMGNLPLAPNAVAVNLASIDLANQCTATSHKANPSLPDPPLVNLDTNHFSPTDKVIAEKGSQLLAINIVENLITTTNEVLTKEDGQIRKTIGEENAKQGLNDLTSSADTIKQSLSQEPELSKKASIIKYNHRDAGNILQIFSKLMEQLKEAAKETGESNQVKSLIQEGTIIERQMVGHQVFQTLNKVEGQQDYLYFNLPFIKQDENQTWGQIKIIKDNSQCKNIDPKHLSMTLLLNTISMGPLLLELKVRNKEIIAGGKVAEQWVANLLRKAWPKLQASFLTAGYHLHTCIWQVGNFTANLLPAGLKMDDSDCGLQTVDIKI